MGGPGDAVRGVTEGGCAAGGAAVGVELHADPVRLPVGERERRRAGQVPEGSRGAVGTEREDREV